VLDIADELLGHTPPLTPCLMRGCGELARQRLGIERLRYFSWWIMKKVAWLALTGTNAQGQTCDEHAHGFPLDDVHQHLLDFASEQGIVAGMSCRMLR
jgi:hypothetical protein